MRSSAIWEFGIYPHFVFGFISSFFPLLTILGEMGFHSLGTSVSVCVLLVKWGHLGWCEVRLGVGGVSWEVLDGTAHLHVTSHRSRGNFQLNLNLFPH